MGSLYKRTLALLRNDARPIKAIAKSAKVNRHWLEKFRQGKFKNPGVNTVERLFNFLNAKDAAHEQRQQTSVRT